MYVLRYSIVAVLTFNGFASVSVFGFRQWCVVIILSAPGDCYYFLLLRDIVF